MSINLPSFLFVGTAKAGTTSLYHYLKEHPDICIPSKETFYFLNDKYQDNNLSYPKQRSSEQVVFSEQDYDDLYNSCDHKIAGEIGTGYLYHYQHCIPKIKKKLGKEVKVLIILRNPIDRTYSSYQHFLKDLHEEGSFEDSLDQEESRMSEGWDFMWHHKSVGLYYNQVKAYLSEFEHVKIILFDELKGNPQKVFSDICEFIGASDKARPDFKRQFNPSGVPKVAWFQKLITQETIFKRIFRPVFRLIYGEERRSAIKKNIKSKNLKRVSPMSEETKSMLINFFKEDIKQLEGLIGLNLSHWYN